MSTGLFTAWHGSVHTSIHKVVLLTALIIKRDNGYLYRTKGCAPNRLTHFTVRQLIATLVIGGFNQPERLLLMLLDTTMDR